MPTSNHRRNGRTRPRRPHRAADTFHPECPACNDPDWTPEKDWERTWETIERHGWQVTAVLGSRTFPPYAYTVGLSLRDLPELVITGLTAEVAGGILNDHARLVASGEWVPEPEGSGGGRFRVIEVTKPGERLAVADNVNGGPVPAYQLVWPSPDGRYPGDPGYDEITWRQPLLGAASW